MTGIDVLAGMMFAACVEGVPIRVDHEQFNIEVTRYECPLIGRHAEFYVWRRLCSEDEKLGLAIEDLRDHRGFNLNQFGGVDVSYVDARASGAYAPACMTKEK